jgi:hypothetical protein
MSAKSGPGYSPGTALSVRNLLQFSYRREPMLTRSQAQFSLDLGKTSPLRSNQRAVKGSGSGDDR